MKRIYISGPMSGIAEHNFPAFNAEAARLRAMGYEVVNPAEMNVGSQDDWHACLRADIKALCDCDTIALMPGWENSKGAHLEVHVAHRLGIACDVAVKLPKAAPPEQLFFPDEDGNPTRTPTQRQRGLGLGVNVN